MLDVRSLSFTTSFSLFTEQYFAFPLKVTNFSASMISDGTVSSSHFVLSWFVRSFLFLLVKPKTVKQSIATTSSKYVVESSQFDYRSGLFLRPKSHRYTPTGIARNPTTIIGVTKGVGAKNAAMINKIPATITNPNRLSVFIVCSLSWFTRICCIYTFCVWQMLDVDYDSLERLRI